MTRGHSEIVRRTEGVALGDPRSREQTLSRRVALQSGAAAVGVLWTKPIARRVQLIGAAGTPAPTTDPTDPTEVTTPTTPETTPETTPDTTPTTQPNCPVTIHVESDCAKLGGSYDVRFRFTALEPGEDVALELAFITGELAPGVVTLTGTADPHGRVAFKPDHSFHGPWSARVALRDAAMSAGSALVAGTFDIRYLCSRGKFTAA